MAEFDRSKEVRFNTGSCAPRIIKQLAEEFVILPEVVASLEVAARRVDDAFVSMLVVTELGRLLTLLPDGINVAPLIYPGIYDIDTDQMMKDAVDDWEDMGIGFSQAPCFLVAGHHDEAGQRPKLAAERLQKRFLYRSHHPKVYSQVVADTAPAQARWVADQVEELDLSALALRVHPFHVARAFLTQLAELKKRGLHEKVVMLPWWSTFNPFGKRMLTGPWTQDVWTDAKLILGEAKRIYDYSAKGDVASLQDLRDYCDWLFTASPATEALKDYTA